MISSTAYASLLQDWSAPVGCVAVGVGDVRFDKLLMEAVQKLWTKHDQAPAATETFQ